MTQRRKTKRRTTKRNHIPLPIQHQVLLEGGYKCGNPCCRTFLTLDIHHIEPVADGGGNDATNLIALCPNCHTLHTKKKIPKSAIAHWKGMLHALNHAFSKESMDLLLFMKHERAKELWLSGDAVLRFAGLISAGLVTFGQTMNINGPTLSGAAPSSSQMLKLTQRGELLVDAWERGDEDAYRKGLTGDK